MGGGSFPSRPGRPCLRDKVCRTGTAWPCGGIGRRCRLKICWEISRVGSSPTLVITDSFKNSNTTKFLNGIRSTRWKLRESSYMAQASTSLHCKLTMRCKNSEWSRLRGRCSENESKGTGGSVRVCRFFISNYFYLQDNQNLLYYSHGY